MYDDAEGLLLVEKPLDVGYGGGGSEGGDGRGGWEAASEVLRE